jgi:hypothetical protein
MAICERCGKRDKKVMMKVVQKFKYEPVEKTSIHLCDECAVREGFCPCCGCFVLGLDDDYTLESHGICAECLEELRYELGEYYD